MTPTPDQIKAAREHAGLTQEQAATLVHLSSRFRWSEYERGSAKIDAARWELFLIKTGQHPTFAKAKAPATIVRDGIRVLA